MKKGHYISVILPLKLEWEPYYLTSETVDVGERVSVMFSGKEYSAVVSATDIAPRIDREKIRPVVSIDRELGKIGTEEIELWRQVSNYYLCTIGEVYKAAYPVGKVNMEEARAVAKKKVVERREKLAAAIEKRLERLQERLRKKTETAARSKEGTKIRAVCLEDIEKIEREISQTKESLQHAISSSEAARSGQLMRTMIPDAAGISLSAAQQEAYEAILEGFKEDKPVLLHGVTGSGKTEIYMKLAMESIAQGRNVLYLVPEIALSRQLEDRLHEQFADRLLTFHSGESAASRRNSAEIIRNARPENGGYIALCTRSGLFLPHHDLGLIIVDEEHDTSYKQDSPAPRYNGRDTALMLHRIHNACKIILGSATPSLEEVYNTSTGRHKLVELKERYHGSEASEVEIIDTRVERSRRGMAGNFSRKLIDHIRTSLQNKGQVLILRSRRAWSTAMQCNDCGEIQKCPHCNVSFSHHKTENALICHYCGTSMPNTGRCLKCGGQLTGLGSGTQKIEEEAATLFPEARIARLDSDTAQNKSFESRTIKDFAKGEIDILIGTQIITKGFDFERLSLVAVIAADTLLGIQDFRADEKAMHLLEQFRGRCGRRDKKGLLVIQTSQPEHPIYKNITGDIQDSFSLRLMSERKDFNFPPYSRIIELTVKDIYEERAERMSSRLAGRLQNHMPTGPYAPVVDKVADRYIRKIRLSLRKDRQLTRHKVSILETIRKFEKESGYEGHITIDVDPA